MSRRGAANRMAESGPPVSAEGFAEVVRTRNRLSRLRPNDPAKQADRLNCACERPLAFSAAADAAAARAARRLSPQPPASP